MKKRMWKLVFVGIFLSSFWVVASFGEDGSETKSQLGKWEQYWVDRVEEFKAENETLDKNEKHILFLGDSLTKAFKVKDYFPELPVINRGIVSDGVCNTPSSDRPYRGITLRMEESIYDVTPSHMFFMIGTNDVGRSSIPYEYWMGAFKYVIWQTRSVFPDVKITLLTCPPTGTNYAKHDYLNGRLKEWNELVKKAAVEENCRLIDVWELLVDDRGLLPDDLTRDGLHFNDLGYKPLSEKIKEILIEDGVMKSE